MSKMLNAKDVQEILQIGECKAYEIIRQLNEELQKKGFMTVRGKVYRGYFNERFFGTKDEQRAIP